MKPNIKSLQDSERERFAKELCYIDLDDENRQVLALKKHVGSYDIVKFLESSILSAVQTAFAETAVERKKLYRIKNKGNESFQAAVSEGMKSAKIKGFNEAVILLSHNQAEFLNNIK